MTQTDPNAEPNANPNPAPAADPNAAPVTPSEDLKPLTEAEIASMSTEEITAHAEKLEEQVKNRKQQTPDQIRENQVRRLQKVQERAFEKNDTTTAPEAKKEIAQADLLTLGKTDFELGSKEQQVLQWYVENGKVASYKEAMNHPAVKAELEAIKAEGNAAAVIDENDPDDVKLRTKKEAIANARATGEVPEDPELRKALVEDNISRMSALK
jgi:hypothetical protein